MTDFAGSSSCSDREARLIALYDNFRGSFPEVPEVSVRELHAWMQDPQAGVLLVDVRTAAEQQVSMLPGRCLTQVEFEEAGPGAFRGSRVVCYCTAGYRSGLYCRQLRARHGVEAANLRGSILAWTQAGFPLVEGRPPSGGRGGEGARGGAHDVAPRSADCEAGSAAAALAAPPAPRPTSRVHVYSAAWALQGPGYTPVFFRRPLLRLAADALGRWGRGLLRRCGRLLRRGGGGRQRGDECSGRE